MRSSFTTLLAQSCAPPSPHKSLDARHRIHTPHNPTSTSSSSLHPHFFIVSSLPPDDSPPTNTRTPTTHQAFGRLDSIRIFEPPKNEPTATRSAFVNYIQLDDAGTAVHSDLGHVYRLAFAKKETSSMPSPLPARPSAQGEARPTCRRPYSQPPPTPPPQQHRQPRCQWEQGGRGSYSEAGYGREARPPRVRSHGAEGSIPRQPAAVLHEGGGTGYHREAIHPCVSWCRPFGHYWTRGHHARATAPPTAPSPSCFYIPSPHHASSERQ